jgi:hypothetical protein
LFIPHKQATQEKCQVFTQLRNRPSIGSENSEDESSIVSPLMHYDETDDANCFLPTTPNELSEILPNNSLYLQTPPISDIESSQTKRPSKHLQEQECNSQLQSPDNFMGSHDQLLQEKSISILVPENIPQQFQSKHDNNGLQQFQCLSHSSGVQCQNLSPEIENLICHDAQASKPNFFTFDGSFLTLDVSILSDLDIIRQVEPHYQQNKIQHKPEQQQQSQETKKNKEQHQVEPQQEKVCIVNESSYLMLLACHKKSYLICDKITNFRNVM